MSNKLQKLLNLKKECLTCKQCLLYKDATQIVFGEGNPNTNLLLIGEAPGREEDKLGLPFVGSAGKLLNKILSACNLKRDDIYITNVLKCRPPNNRIPTFEEINKCFPWLCKQIEIINPKIIVCLGATASKTLIDPNFSITKQRGRWYRYRNIPVMPTYHPAALLRDVKKKLPVWNDFKEVLQKTR